MTRTFRTVAKDALIWFERVVPPNDDERYQRPEEVAFKWLATLCDRAQDEQIFSNWRFPFFVEAIQSLAYIGNSDIPYWRIKDAAPEWIADLDHRAHGVQTPNDWRYRFIVDALQHFADGNDPRGYAPEHGYSTPELADWLCSRAYSESYVDEARAPYLAGGTKQLGKPVFLSIWDDIHSGLSLEWHETFDLVREALSDFFGVEV
jgi:hypothetical protein